MPISFIDSKDYLESLRRGIMMSKEDKKKKRNIQAEVKDGKIYYGKNKIVCFACGEEVESGTRICPYCNTVLEKSEEVNEQE
jgi:hypothetical protein